MVWTPALQMDRFVLPLSFDELAVLPTMHLSSVSGTTPRSHAYAHSRATVKAWGLLV